MPPPKTPDFIEPDILLKTETLIFKTQNANVKDNGLRYLRWGGDGEAVQPEKG
ncbi:MAG: hypothetical protein HS124_07045 [Anaerolineales bacterium]|nr:hypothetical protein [Anaerolineales bacterium]